MLAVFLVNQAPPASADHSRDMTIWSGALTVKDLGNFTAGCDTAQSQQARKCSTSTTLSEDEFTYKGTNYQIGGLLNYQAEEDLAIFLSSGNQVVSPNIFRGLALVVDGKRYSFFSATIDDQHGSATWDVSSNWSVGDTVNLKLTTQYWTGVDLYGGGLVHHSDGAQTLDITSESGESFFYVRLDQAPTATTTITLQKNFTQCSGCGREYHGDVNAADVSPTTLTFTTSDWQTGQTVFVNGVPDSDSVHEHVLILANVSIASGADSDDPYRNPERVNGVWVTIHDGSDDGSDHGGL